MVRAFLLVLFSCALFSCSKKGSYPAVGSTPVDTVPRTTADTLKTFLALGDSFTIGQSVSASERFPAQTVAFLKGLGVKINDPVYIAQTGWTTGNLQNAIAVQNPAPTYDVVSLLIGVNDQYQRMDTGGYAVRFTQLLEKAIQLARGSRARVFVLSIPDYSVTPFVPQSDKLRVRTEIDWFNAINKRITTAYSISYTDITPSSRQAETDPSLIAGDNLHPSGLEYKKWAELLAPKMKAVLP